MKKRIILFLILIQINCLNPKKSIFDFNGPNGVGFGGIILNLLDSGNGSRNGSGTGSGSSTGTGSGTATGSSTIQAISATVSVAYPSAPNMLDYIRRNMASPSSLEQVGTLCDGTETGWYNSCIHAGEIRRIEMTNISDCNDVTATDNLGAFNWTCRIQSGKVFVYSTGLKEDKNLSDLIDFTGKVWRDNSVTVRKGSQVISTAVTSKWWTNAIEEITIPGPRTLNTKGRIYIINTSFSGNYTFANTNMALIVNPANVMNNTAPFVLLNIQTSSNSHFIWIEGKFTQSAQGLLLDNSNGGKFMVLRNFSGVRNFAIQANVVYLQNLGDAGIYIHNSRFQNISNPNTILELALKKTIVYNSIFSNGLTGIFFNSTAPDTILNGVTTSNANDSNLVVGDNGFFLNTTNTNNNASSDSVFMNGASQNTFMNTGISNTSNSALSLTVTASNNNTFVNLLNFFTQTNPFLEIGSGSSNIQFNGNLFFSSGAICSAAGGTSMGVNNSCDKVAPSELSIPSNKNINASAAYMGKVTSESRNTHSTGAVATILDRHNFENRFRAWGLDDPNNFPHANHRGFCNGASMCRIWDWSLNKNDSSIRDVNSCPDGNSFGVHTWSDSTTIQYLRNASERMFDGVGNDNGICESNEDCIFTPNIASYQGHGNLIPASTTNSFTKNCPNLDNSKTIKNVNLFKYELNGY